LLFCGCAGPSGGGDAQEKQGLSKSGDEKDAPKTTASSKKTATTQKEKEKAEKKTLKEAWKMLVENSEKGDLRFWAYMTFNLDSEGRTDHYTVTGYSPADKKTYYAQSSETTGVKYGDIDNPSGITNTYDIEEVKDTPQMVEEIIKLKGGCGKGMRIEFTAYMKTAQATCMPEWSSVDRYSYLK